MRRISLALALAGAVTAAGCSGGATSTTGGNPGVTENTFKVTIQNGQNGNTSLALTGGFVVSTPAGIDCGVGRPGPCEFQFGAAETVVLTPTAVAPNVFFGFAGDCVGTACTLVGPADRYIVAQFTTADRATGHPNWENPAIHAANYVSDAFNCQACHGATLAGAGIIPGCTKCHEFPFTAIANDAPAANDDVVGDHFRVTAAFDDHGSGWSSSCLRCHTHEGFRDYVGVDGSDEHLGTTFKPTNANTTCVTATSAIGADGRPFCVLADGTTPDTSKYAFGPLRCTTCHNPNSEPLTNALTTVRFPSTGSFAALPVAPATYPNITAVENPLNLTVTNTVDGSTGVCAQCHQGRESTASVNARIASSATGGLDDVIGTGTFINPHYLGAAGTMFGADAKMWAEYPGKIYSGRMEHGGKASCTFCHDPHTGHLPADSQIAAKCGTCHFNEAGAAVSSLLELEEVRQFGYEGDIDGDEIEESLKEEIEGLEVVLYAKMQEYAASTGTAICYNGGAHPYFFIDTDASGGECSASESVSANSFKAFTPRLLRAAFNFKWAHAEPGAWAHNPRYVIEVLFDGIVDLRQGLGETVNIATTPQKRAFNGHFGGAEDASPYSAMVYHAWDNPPMGFTSGACYQCHGGAKGLAEFLENQVAPAWPAPGGFTAYQVNAIQCSTCHTNGDDMKITESPITTLNFPGQKVAEQSTVIDAVEFFPNPADRACAACHSGREGTLSIDTYITSIGGEAAGWVGAFKNPHYLGAAGVLLGSNARMMFEFPGKTYTANPPHFGSPHGSLHGSSCTGCHEPKGTAHTFEITAEDMAPTTGKCGACHAPTAHGDFTLSNIEHEFVTLRDELKAAIVAYSDAAVVAAVPGANRVCYKENHPYFTVDSAAPYGFLCDAADTGSPKMDPALIRAAGNLKWAMAEPGAWAHNTEYALEILYDSIVALGGTPSETPASRVVVP
jgi:uncharacterized protein YgfB (UPF0149 family)